MRERRSVRKEGQRVEKEEGEQKCSTIANKKTNEPLFDATGNHRRRRGRFRSIACALAAHHHHAWTAKADKGITKQREEKRTTKWGKIKTEIGLEGVRWKERAREEKHEAGQLVVMPRPSRRSTKTCRPLGTNTRERERRCKSSCVNLLSIGYERRRFERRKIEYEKNDEGERDRKQEAWFVRHEIHSSPLCSDFSPPASWRTVAILTSCCRCCCPTVMTGVT